MQERWFLSDPHLVQQRSPCKTGKVIADGGELAQSPRSGSFSLTAGPGHRSLWRLVCAYGIAQCYLPFPTPQKEGQKDVIFTRSRAHCPFPVLALLSLSPSSC